MRLTHQEAGIFHSLYACTKGSSNCQGRPPFGRSRLILKAAGAEKITFQRLPVFEPLRQALSLHRCLYARAGGYWSGKSFQARPATEIDPEVLRPAQNHKQVTVRDS